MEHKTLQKQIEEVLPKEKELYKEDDHDCELCLNNEANYEKGYNQALQDVHSSIPKVIEIVKEDIIGNDNAGWYKYPIPIQVFPSKNDF